MKFTASRLSEGNKLFPDEINIDETSVTIKSPKLFGGISKSFPLGQITISINSPMFGYSDITLFSQGTGMHVHGFTVSDANKIKKLIESVSSQRREDDKKLERSQNWEVNEDIMNESRSHSYGNRIFNEDEIDVFELLVTKMRRQAESERREVFQSEINAAELLKNMLAGKGEDYDTDEYHASSNAHIRAIDNEINDNLSIDEHLEAFIQIKEIEDYWMLGKEERLKIDKKKTNVLFSDKSMEINIKTDLELIKKENNQLKNDALVSKKLIADYKEMFKDRQTKIDPNKFSKEILSVLESETDETFSFIPEFERFVTKDNPLLIGYLFTNSNLRSLRLNFTITGELYSATYWISNQEEATFTINLCNLSIEKAINKIITYYKYPSVRNLIKYSETEYNIGDKDEMYLNLSNYLEKMFASNDISSLIITKQSSIEIIKYVTDKLEKENGLIFDKDYFKISGDLSGTDLFINLYKLNGKIIILHDTDTSLRDESFVKILRQVIDSKIKRQIHYIPNCFIIDPELNVPDSFEFTGKIIFISNLPKKKIHPLILPKSTSFEIALNNEETKSVLWLKLPKIEIPSGDIIKGVARNKALDLLIKASEELNSIELSQRSLLKAITIVNKYGNSEIQFNLIKQHCSNIC